jgi:acetyltransferase
MQVEVANEAVTQQNLPQLNTLLVNAVNSGASIGWIPPMSESAAEAYWRSRMAEIDAGSRVLLLAWEDEIVIGSAQLGLEQRENGNHRA